VRERLEEHRKNAVCAACHKMMDPIGFALDNFDPVGAWRIKDSGFSVDATGQLFDGAKLDGPASLRQAILSHSGAFLSTFTESLLAYGSGRVVDYRDMPIVRSIAAEAAHNDNRFSTFVAGIVKSAPVSDSERGKKRIGTGGCRFDYSAHWTGALKFKETSSC